MNEFINERTNEREWESIVNYIYIYTNPSRTKENGYEIMEETVTKSKYYWMDASSKCNIPFKPFFTNIYISIYMCSKSVRSILV